MKYQTRKLSNCLLCNLMLFPEHFLPISIKNLQQFKSHDCNDSIQYLSLLWSQKRSIWQHLLSWRVSLWLTSSLHCWSFHRTCDLHTPVENLLVISTLQPLTTSPPVILFSLPFTSQSYLPQPLPFSPSVDGLVSYFIKIRRNNFLVLHPLVYPPNYLCPCSLPSLLFLQINYAYF